MTKPRKIYWRMVIDGEEYGGGVTVGQTIADFSPEFDNLVKLTAENLVASYEAIKAERQILKAQPN